jgi:hypothetical protein
MFVNRPLGFAVLAVATTWSGHAGGMKAISRRLSAATPPESRVKVAASRRDAGNPLDTLSEARMVHAAMPFRMLGFSRIPVVSLALNNRLNRCDAIGIGYVI